MKFPRMAGLVKLFGASLILAAAGATHAAPCSSDGSLASCGFEEPLGGGWVVDGTATNVDVRSGEGRGSTAADPNAALRSARDTDAGKITQGGLDGNSVGYRLEFWLRLDPAATSGFPAGLFKVSIGDVNDAFSDLTGITPGSALDGWTPFSGLIGPVENDWQLSFEFLDQDVANVYMDDVTLAERSANGVPEPGTLLLLGLAMAAGAVVRRKA